jgi:hypothetical protein
MRDANKDGKLDRFREVVEELNDEMAEVADNMQAINDASGLSPDEVDELSRELEDYLSMGADSPAKPANQGAVFGMSSARYAFQHVYSCTYS